MLAMPKTLVALTVVKITVIKAGHRKEFTCEVQELGDWKARFARWQVPKGYSILSISEPYEIEAIE